MMRVILGNFVTNIGLDGIISSVDDASVDHLFDLKQIMVFLDK